MANYSFRTSKKPPDVKNGDTLIAHNFMQQHPNTEIFKGIEKLTFVSCNLMNCKLPKDSTIKDCLTVQKSMCSHLHDWEFTNPCEINCSHVIDSDIIQIDGTIIDIIYHYEDTVL